MTIHVSCTKKRGCPQTHPPSLSATSVQPHIKNGALDASQSKTYVASSLSCERFPDCSVPHERQVKLDPPVPCFLVRRGLDDKPVSSSPAGNNKSLGLVRVRGDLHNLIHRHLPQSLLHLAVGEVRKRHAAQYEPALQPRFPHVALQPHSSCVRRQQRQLS